MIHSRFREFLGTTHQPNTVGSKINSFVISNNRISRDSDIHVPCHVPASWWKMKKQKGKASRGGGGQQKGEWEAEVDPAKVRFTHSKISPVFSDGKLGLYIS